MKLLFHTTTNEPARNGEARSARCPSALLQGIWATYPHCQTFTYAGLDSGNGCPSVKSGWSPKERRWLAIWSRRRWSACMIPKFFLNWQPFDDLNVISNDLWTLMIQNSAATPLSLMSLLRSRWYSANDDGKRRHLKTSSNDHHTRDLIYFF